MRFKINQRFLISSLVVAFFSACGGGRGDASAPNELTRSEARGMAFSTSVIGAPDYTMIVQQLYISYFGRPADPSGLSNFKSQLAALNGPTDIQKLDQAYHTNAGIKALVDSFGVSAESAALYSGDNLRFITGIYANVLNRAPDSEGLAFWVGALDSGSVTRANASLSIMAGALANSTPQGLLDGTLVSKKITVGSTFTDALLKAPVNGYNGDTAAAKARAMLSSVTSTTDIQTFQGTIAALVSDLAGPAVVPTPSLALHSVDSFFGDRLASLPYNAVATSNQMLIGSSIASLGTFKLTATGSNFTITNLSATDSTGRVAPFFSNLSNSQVIAAGSSVTFSLKSPLTNNFATNLIYKFMILESGATFTHTVNFKSN